MSKHTWVQENLASYVAGGLDAGERERFEQHVAECGECAAALDDARAFDRHLGRAFAGVQPDVALEDRMIQRLRFVPGRRAWRPSRALLVVMGAAAVLLLAFLGAGINAAIDRGDLAFPREDGFTVALNNLKQIGSPLHWYKEEQGIFTGASIAIGGAEGEAKQLDDTVYKRDPASPRTPDDRTTLARDFVSPQMQWGVPSLESLSEEIKDKSLLREPPLLTTDMDPSSSDGEIKGYLNGKLGTYGFSVAPSNSPPSQTPPAGESGGKPVLGVRGFDTSGPMKTPLGFTPTTESAPPPSPPGNGTLIFSPDGRRVTSSGGDKMGPGWGRAEGKSSQMHYFKLGGKGTSTDNFEGEGLQERKPAEGDEKGSKSDPAKNPPGKGEKLEDLFAQLQKQPEGQPEVKPAPADQRKIIRTGEIEFEVKSFDAAVSTINDLIGPKGKAKSAFISTSDSQKLPNGKMRGLVVVRIAPLELDDFITALKKELTVDGELKSQQIRSQDITKQYTDIESRLRAARTMEERLLKIIKDGKGEIKDLLQAEKELGVWRTKIEEMEGELRYYGNQVSLSTLTIILVEKEIRTAALILANERIQAGIEVEDVAAAADQARGIIDEAKGRITCSELKQHAAGQFNAVLNFEVPPDAAALVRDRLRQIGNMVRLEIDLVQRTEDGQPAPRDGKVKRGDTQFFVSIYNLANVEPRETVAMRIAASDVPDAYQKLREVVGSVKSRIANVQLNVQNPQNVTAQLDFDIRRTDEPKVQTALKDAGDIVSRSVGRRAEGENVTDAKIGYRIELVNIVSIPARETVTMKIAALNVAEAYEKLREAVGKTSSRVTNADLNVQDQQNVTARLDFDVRRSDEDKVKAELKGVGAILSRQVNRQADNENVTDTKVAFKIELTSANNIPPRETVQLGIVVSDVQAVQASFTSIVKEAGGRVLTADTSLEPYGRVFANLLYDVPLAAKAEIVEKFKQNGQVRIQRLTRDPQAPEGELASARIQMSLENGDLLVPRDQGFWAQIRTGLSVSLLGFLYSLSWLIVGVLFVLPWVLVIWAVIWLARRMWRGGRSEVPSTPAP